MREPLPLACATSAAYAEAARRRATIRRRGARASGTSALRTSTRRTTSPSTSSSSAACLPFDELLAARRAPTSRRRLGARTRPPLRPPTRAACGTGLLGCEEVDDRERRRSPFDVCGPLPTGVTVLEASAGTGKTYTIAALAARYVAEGIAARAAAARDVHAHGHRRAARARARAAGRRRGRAATRSLAGAEPGRDEVVAAARRRAPRERGRDAPRPTSPRALADFDAATIATTHGFCQEVLGGLGVAGDVEPDIDVRRGPRRPASTRSSTTSTSARFHWRRRGRAFDRARRRSQIARAAVEQPDRAARARRRAADDRRRRCAAGSRCAVRAELERAQAARWRS